MTAAVTRCDLLTDSERAFIDGLSRSPSCTYVPSDVEVLLRILDAALGRSTVAAVDAAVTGYNRGRRERPVRSLLTHLPGR